MKVWVWVLGGPGASPRARWGRVHARRVRAVAGACCVQAGVAWGCVRCWCAGVWCGVEGEGGRGGGAAAPREECNRDGRARQRPAISTRPDAAQVSLSLLRPSYLLP